MASARKRLKMNTTKLKVELLDIDSLLPYARNSRTHSESQVTQIAKSIKEFGFTNPVLIDEGDNVIAGHGRILAAKLLEFTNIPCIRLTHLTNTQKRAYVIADNQLALNASWDEKLLSEELAALSDLDFDVSLTGFSLPEGVDGGSETAEERVGPPTFPEVGEDLKTEHQCPKCGYAWSGKSK